jgi:hypothetical protein
MNKEILADALNYVDERKLEQHIEKKMRISPGWGINSNLKGGDSMNPNAGRKKWVITIVIAAILIAAAVAVAILAGPGPDDPVIDLHIPSGKSLKPELVDESFKEIRKFLAECFPEKEYKGFIITSWVLSPIVHDLLGQKGNIVNFGNRFIKVTKKDKATSVFSFVFLQKDVNNVDLEALPENTSLERALKKHYLEGKKVYDTYGFILK